MRPTVSVVGICIVPGRRITTLRMRLRGAMMVHVFEAVRTYIALLFFSLGFSNGQGGWFWKCSSFTFYMFPPKSYRLHTASPQRLLAFPSIFRVFQLGALNMEFQQLMIYNKRRYKTHLGGWQLNFCFGIFPPQTLEKWWSNVTCAYVFQMGWVSLGVPLTVYPWCLAGVS